MDFQGWILAHGRGLQLAGFLGTLVFLALLETWTPAFRFPPDRKKRWPANFLLPLSTFFALAALPVTGLGVSAWAADQGFGLLNRIALPGAAALLVTLAARSLAAWLFHVLMHKVPFLWRIHRIHHMDPVMDVSTTLRFHPLELTMSLAVVVLTHLLFGLPVWALLVYEPLEAAIRYFSHANIRLGLGSDRILRLVISTPAMHRIHHSIVVREFNSNYGTIFSLWDRLFGTYLSPHGKDLARMRLGTRGFGGNRVLSFGWLLANPFLQPARLKQKRAAMAALSEPRKTLRVIEARN